MAGVWWDWVRDPKVMSVRPPLTRPSALRRVRAFALLLCGSGLQAQTAERGRVEAGGRAELYVARDLVGGSGARRAFAGGAPFTVHAARTGGPAANLAIVFARYRGARFQGGFALQAGTAVDSRPGGRGGLVRHVHEAGAGIRMGDLEVDAGIQPAHTGMEAWHGPNLTYTRSLLADYAPTHLAGVGVSGRLHRLLHAQVRAVHGWDTVADSTGGGIGARIDWRPRRNALVSGFNLIVRAPPGRGWRRLHGFGARAITGALTTQIEAHLGSQEHSAASGRPAHWWGYAAVARLRAAPAVHVSTRFERFDDDEQIVLRTGSSGGVPNAPFRGYGESLGVDVRYRRFTWRSELRAFQNSGPGFPSRTSPARALVAAVTAIEFRVTNGKVGG